MKKYFYKINGKQFGPFTKEEMKDLKLKNYTLVWYEGLSDWESLSNAPELISLVDPASNTTLESKIN